MLLRFPELFSLTLVVFEYLNLAECRVVQELQNIHSVAVVFRHVVGGADVLYCFLPDKIDSATSIFLIAS